VGINGWLAWHDPLVSLFLLLAALAVLAAIAVVAAGNGGSLAPTAPDRSPLGVLPVDDIDRAAIEDLRFTLAFRGYRMDEVDNVLERLVSELETRDARIAELETRDESPARQARDEPRQGRTDADAAREV
jgi:DivIVA domain-containing protein